MAKRGVVLSCLCFAFLVMMAFPTTSSLAATDEVPLMTAWTFSGKETVYFTAIEKGWYGENNISLKVLRGYGGIQTVMAVDQGKVAYGYAPIGSVILTRNKGGKVKLIGMLLNDSEEGFVSLKEKGIKKPKDMEGRKLGLSAATTSRVTLPVLCKINKIDCGKIDLITIDPGVYQTSLLTGTVDMIPGFKGSNYDTVYLGAKESGKEVNWIGYSDWGLDLYGGGFFASEETLAQKKDLTKRFLKATYKGINYAFSHPEEAVEIMMKHNPELNKAVVGRQLNSVLELNKNQIGQGKAFTGHIDQKKMKFTVETLLQAYGLKADQSVTDFYTNEFLPAAN